MGIGALGWASVQDGYGDTKEPSISPEAVHALLGKDLTTEQRLKLSSTAIDAVIKGDDTDDRRQDAAATEERGSVEKETEAVPETTTEGQQALGQLGQALGLWSAEDESEFQQPYKDSLDYLNDQFSLLECEIRIAEHRRQSTKEDVGRVLLVNFKTLYSHNDTGLHEEDGSNVLKLFREAEMSDAVLFFDECESLFSQRGSGGSSELTALLTAMERYEGIIFLATNRPFDLDEAMYRRITSVFTFSKPDHVQRVPLALDIDWEKIAMKFALTGGYIKNAIVSALLLAISRNNVDPKVTEEDITGGCIMQVRGSLQMQSFAKRLVPRAGLDSLVLAPNLKQKLLEIVAFEKARPLLLESWGFGDPGSLAQLGSGRREAEVIRVFPRQICL
eukprot:g17593.t1